MTSPPARAMPRAMTYLLVALGGAIGACLRYATGLAVAFPFGTLMVNVIGSLIMGLALVMIADKGLVRGQLFLMTGLLGGFTTFSAFSLDTLKLVEAGHWAGAMTYVAGSVGLSLLAVVVGVVVARGMGL